MSPDVVVRLKPPSTPPTRAWTATSGSKTLTNVSKYMYTNIDAEHVFETIGIWLSDYERGIPFSFPTDAIKSALKLVMTSNIFEFGDCFS